MTSASACTCYCCPNFPKRSNPEMDLDAALHELDMLSTCTESRRQYIREQHHYERKKSVSPGSFLIRWDSRFITEFSFSKPDSSSNAEAEHSNTCSSDDSLGTNIENEAASCPVPSDKGWKLNTRRCKKFRIGKPYDFRLRRSEMTSLLSVPNSEKEAAIDVPLPAGSISRQDSGNKSNPGSPVKNHELNSAPGCSIFRSRSLDNLENAAFELHQPDSCHSVTGRIDIDSVSQRISNLHVS